MFCVGSILVRVTHGYTPNSRSRPKVTRRTKRASVTSITECRAGGRLLGASDQPLMVQAHVLMP
jgi:hypothetical protein